MSLSTNKIIDIAVNTAKEKLKEGNRELGRKVIQRAMRVLIHGDHPIPDGWQHEIMKKLNAQPGKSNLGIVGYVTPSVTSMALTVATLSRTGRSLQGNGTKH